MKKRLFVLFAITSVLLVLGGIPVWASPTSPNLGEIVLTEANNGQRVQLRGSNVLVLNLESNPSTGYSWEIKGLNKAVLQPMGYPAWVSESGLLGAPGTTVMRFAGVAEGKTQVDLVYRRPWEDAAPAKTFSVEVQVADPAPVLQNTGLDASTNELSSSTNESSVTSLPSSFNWCDQGACTAIRDQASCGSCWAFGTVGPLESAILIKDGKSKDVSEQYLVSCNVDGWGCDGGWWAHDYHEWKIPPSESAAGAVYESAFPYSATDESCNGPYNHYEKLNSWAYVGNDSSVPSTDAIKQAIYTYGPVSAAVCVDSRFQSYDSGVFTGGRPPCRNVNHAIVLVGWDDGGQYWILRNSWGTGWGENGYMRIEYGANQVGYSANYVDYGSGGNTPPVASFTYTCSELACDFDGSGSYDPDGSIVGYEWDFGDGATATGVTASHTYAADGTYTVILTVTDDGGATGSDSQDVSVGSGGGGDFTLTATGYKVRGRQKADLEWSGATSTNVDVYRDGALITTTPNDGFYTDNIDQVGGGSYIYKVCEEGTTTCSNEATVNF